MSQKFVAYRRCSTDKQKRSGLGLEAQDKMIADYVRSVGGEIVGQFMEAESSKVVDRPELRKAMLMARRQKAVLLVAKLDRLARNVAFVSALLETPGAEFRAADMPSASRMMIQMLAVFAEYEREQISKRTKEAFAARKARGLPMGTPANLDRTNAPAVNRAKAQAKAERLRPVIDAIKAAGITTVRGITDELNRRGYATPDGGAFHPTTTARLLARLTPAAPIVPNSDVAGRITFAPVPSTATA